MPVISDHQRQILGDLAAGLPVKAIAARGNITRQRCQAQIDTLRIRGILRTDPPTNSVHKELHPQDSRTNPWPAPARYLLLFPATDHELVIRSVLLPRADGAELPTALPDTRAVVLTRPGMRGALSWEVSRRERWPIDATIALYSDWVACSYKHLPQRLSVPPVAALEIEQIEALTSAIAWAADTEAIMYRIRH